MSRAAGRGGKGHLTAIIVLFAVLIIDQLSKSWVLYGLDLPERGTIAILPCLNFTMVWNNAVTFGMFAGHGPALFVTISLIAVFILFLFLARSKSFLVSIACGGIIGGALGNVIDRLVYGKVVDFLHFHVAGWSWYVFNIADSAIVCGVALWMLDAFLAEQREKRI